MKTLIECNLYFYNETEDERLDGPIVRRCEDQEFEVVGDTRLEALTTLYEKVWSMIEEAHAD